MYFNYLLPSLMRGASGVHKAHAFTSSPGTEFNTYFNVYNHGSVEYFVLVLFCMSCCCT